ncbi:MAG: GtrA family protein [Actinomycetia bacterium]|nr:GtrA family protein [Actinomycetes bacterium]
MTGQQTGQEVGRPEPRLRLQTQLVRFVLVGGVSAVVDFGLLTGLMALGLGHTPAKALSFVAGTTTAYLMNRRWTFQADGSPKTFTAVLALYGTTFVVQVGLFAWMFGWLDARWGTRTAQVVGFVTAQGVATTVNFIVQRAVIFRHRA